MQYLEPKIELISLEEIDIITVSETTVNETNIETPDDWG